MLLTRFAIRRRVSSPAPGGLYTWTDCQIWGEAVMWRLATLYRFQPLCGCYVWLWRVGEMCLAWVSNAAEACCEGTAGCEASQRLYHLPSSLVLPSHHRRLHCLQVNSCRPSARLFHPIPAVFWTCKLWPDHFVTPHITGTREAHSLSPDLWFRFRTKSVWANTT